MKWFDYQAMPDKVARLHFTLAFLRAYADFQERYRLDVCFDPDGKEYVRVLPWCSGLDIFKDDDFTRRLDRLRTLADKYMMPYTPFCAISFSVAADQIKSNDLLTETWDGMDLRGAIADKCKEYHKERIVLSDSPRFSAIRYEAGADQNNYYAYLEMIFKARYPDSAAGTLQAIWHKGRYLYPEERSAPAS